MQTCMLPSMQRGSTVRFPKAAARVKPRHDCIVPPGFQKRGGGVISISFASHPLSDSPARTVTRQLFKIKTCSPICPFDVQD